MQWSKSVLLNLIILVLVAVCFVLQIVAISTEYWATFDARTELGKPKETGHYGLWRLCVTRLPRYVEDCDPLDTFFQAPQFAHIAGVLGVIHVIQLSSLFPLGLIRFIQIIKNSQDLLINSKVLSIGTVLVAFITVIFSILVAILASVGENKSVEYVLNKSWSFWLQISVIGIEFGIVVLCAIQNFLFWYQRIKDSADPMGHHAETYNNPYGDTESDPPSEFTSISSQPDNLNGGGISFTDASGIPPLSGPTVRPKEPRNQRFLKEDSNNKANLIESKLIGYESRLKQDAIDAKSQTSSGVLTYENPSFQEHSPSSRRSAQIVV